MAKIYSLCSAFYFLVAGFATQHDSNTLTTNQKIVKIATAEIGVRELTGRNDGPRVAQYLAYTGNYKGEAWCASFVSWVFGQAGYPSPRSAWSPALFPKARLTQNVTTATVFGIYFANKRRIAHVGLIAAKRGDWLTTIEGNTNIASAREGDGVYRKLRHCRTIAAFADWLTPAKKGVYYEN